MKVIQKITAYFSKTELLLCAFSILLILTSFFLFDQSNRLTPAAALLGVISILFNAKGNPLGQLLMILFSLFYGYVSYTFSYYGEMITYLGMTMPMAFFSLLSWLRHPYKGKKNEVTVGNVSRAEFAFMLLFALVITLLFYFLLSFFHTANLYPSTLSVTTSFIAVYLTFRRSPFFSVAYALNDIVLILLWILASMEDTKYVSMVSCFVAFLLNDCYCFVSWRAMEKRQRAT